MALPALADVDDLAPLLPVPRGDVDEDKAQAALLAASSEVRDAAQGRTFLDGAGQPVLPGTVRTVLLDAARRAYILYASDGSYTSSEQGSVDDFNESRTSSLDATVLAGAELTPGERARVAAYGPSGRGGRIYTLQLGDG